jgi:hypothetical protein
MLRKPAQAASRNPAQAASRKPSSFARLRVRTTTGLVAAKLR